MQTQDIKTTEEWNPFNIVGNLIRVLGKTPSELTQRQYRILLGYILILLIIGWSVGVVVAIKAVEIQGDPSSFWMVLGFVLVMISLTHLDMVLRCTKARLKALGASNDEAYTLLIPFYNLYKIWDISQREDKK